MNCQSINPANGETLQTFKEITDHKLEAALQTAAALTFAERAAIANRAAESLRSRLDAFAWPVMEMGKRVEEGRAEVRLSADIIACYDQANRVIDDPRINQWSGVDGQRRRGVQGGRTRGEKPQKGHAGTGR